jgi:hypothetical protein
MVIVVLVQRTYCRNVTETKSYNRAVVETESGPTLHFAERSPNRAPVAPPSLRPGLSFPPPLRLRVRRCEAGLKPLPDQEPAARDRALRPSRAHDDDAPASRGLFGIGTPGHRGKIRPQSVKASRVVFARVGSLERVMHPRKADRRLSFDSVEPRATRPEISPLPVI